jgi:hypothetical protein
MYFTKMDYLNHSLFKSNKQKHVRFSRETLSVIDGANTLAHINMNNWRTQYEQFFQTTIFLKEDSYHQEINYGGLGTQITFIMIKVSYEPTDKRLDKKDTPYLEYIFGTNTDEVRTFDNILVLSGTDEKKLPKIFLNNPNKKHKAKVEILACTTEIHSEELPDLVQLNNNTFDIHDLEYSHLISDDYGTSIIIQREPNQPMASFALDRISNIELNGRIMIVDDSAIGSINLFFKSVYHCLQAYSLINWTLKDPVNNMITYNLPPDTQPPRIIWKSTFNVNFDLTYYEVCSECDINNKYMITKEDIIYALVDKIEDYDSVGNLRDGEIYIDSSNVTLTEVNQNLKLEAITKTGKYHFTLEVSDMAGNIETAALVLTVY